MRQLRDLPNTAGFEFIGIDRSGNEHDCIVRIDPVGCYSVYRKQDGAPFFMSLLMWRKASDVRAAECDCGRSEKLSGYDHHPGCAVWGNETQS